MREDGYVDGGWGLGCSGVNVPVKTMVQLRGTIKPIAVIRVLPAGFADSVVMHLRACITDRAPGV